MRERQEVLDKFRELRDRYLKERKEAFLGRKPINCVHNVKLRVKGKGHFCFCQNPLILSKCGNQKMFLCNEDDSAQRCQVFSCKNTSEMVEQTFEEIMASPARCGNDYPKLAMLIWFLQDFDVRSRPARFGQLLKRLFGSIWGIISCRWW